MAGSEYDMSIEDEHAGAHSRGRLSRSEHGGLSNDPRTKT